MSEKIPVEFIERWQILIVSKHKVKEERKVLQEVFLKIKEKESKRKQVHSSIHKLQEITSHKNRQVPTLSWLLKVSKIIFKFVANHHTQQKSLHLVYMVSVIEECPILENLKQSHYQLTLFMRKYTKQLHYLPIPDTRLPDSTINIKKPSWLINL